MKWFCLLILFSIDISSAADWPFWRGDLSGSGETSETSLPIKWGEETNIKWRVDLPEPGNSTPAVFGNRIYVTQPESEKSGQKSLVP